MDLGCCGRCGCKRVFIDSNGLGWGYIQGDMSGIPLAAIAGGVLKYVVPAVLPLAVSSFIGRREGGERRAVVTPTVTPTRVQPALVSSPVAGREPFLLFQQQQVGEDWKKWIPWIALGVAGLALIITAVKK